MSHALARAGLDKYSVQLRDCCEALFFWLRTQAETGELGIKLKSAPFCHNRHCPICGWRRGMKVKATLYAALPAIMDQYPTSRWLFLTLTVRNCPVDELRATIQHMGKSLKRMQERKNWPAQGWICGTEVTTGKDRDGTAHPHFHLLLQVPSSYFKGPNYIPTREWVRRWRDAARLDYDPVVDIRPVKPSKKALQRIEEAKARGEDVDTRVEALRGAIAEITKYAAKASDLTQAGPEWLATYIEQVHGLKFLTSGGTLKGVLKDLRKQKGDDEDLVHVGDEGEEGGSDDDPTLAFHWRAKRGQYQRKRN
ncbi:protein rep (plasmid) [Acidithiobacillus sp. M4-SHS-6]|uniref:protein rep n=1 Tax=Acidithiobacillus sp. M4-SHS-6 TaxID=3383024 RepID=UPI0039BDBFDE